MTLCLGCCNAFDEKFGVCPHFGYAIGTPPLEAYHLTPGVRLQKRYIVGRALGFGGFGVTYIGWDMVLKRKVAIKEYLPTIFGN